MGLRRRWQEASQFAGYPVKSAKKEKKKKKTGILKKKKKRNSRILHDPEHRGSAGGVETLVEKVDSFSGIFFWRTGVSVMRRCAARVPVCCRCLQAATSAAFTAALSAPTLKILDHATKNQPNLRMRNLLLKHVH